MSSSKNEYFERLCDLINESKKATNFTRVVSAVTPLSASETQIQCELVIGQEHINGKRTMHGGQSASLIDIFTQWAVKVSAFSEEGDLSLTSVDISCSYMNPTPIGETIIIDAKILKLGRSMAFTECELRRKSDGRILVKGQQTISISKE